MRKLFKTVEINTEFEQDIRIFPASEWDAIQLQFKEFEDKYNSKSLYLDYDTAKTLVNEIQEMFHYIKDGK